MKIPEALQDALVNEDYDALESEWLNLAAEHPEELGLFVRVADTLESLGEESRVGPLLSLLDEQLQEQNLWDDRLDLIEAAGKRYLRPGTIHATTLDTVTHLYKDREDALEVLMPAVGLDRSKDDTPKLWDKVHRLRNLLTYEVGVIVAMEGKGVGTITDVNLTLQTLKIDFERIKGMSVGFRAAGKMLDLVQPGHVLHDKLTALESLSALKPPELLHRVLDSYDQPLTGAQVKGVVVGIIPEKRWSSWWTSARKHPQVLANGSGAKATYTWARTADDANEAIWQKFEAAQLAERLDFLRRAAQQRDGLADRMAEALSPLGEALLEGDTATAFKVWDALDRATAGVSWSPEDQLREAAQPLQFLSQLDTRALRERAYSMVREVREDWLDVLHQRFPAETETKALEALAGHLDDAGREVLDRAIDQALSQPQKTAGAATWVAEFAAEDEALRQRRGPKILRTILNGLSDEAFSSYRGRLSELCESGGTVPRILSGLSADQAVDAKAAIERSRGLEDYQRDPLLTSLHLRFPHLEQPEEEPLYATAESFEAKRAELKELVEQEIPTNRRAIEEAREMGDLRENFEYKSARQRHEYLAARADELNRQIQRCAVLDPASIGTDEVRVGARLQLSGETGDRQLTILGPWESDPEGGVISHESDLARAILGRKIGDRIQVADDEFEITAIDSFGA